ncbi:MAG: hypothetical protein R6X34_01935 [Chloroflexota bacterium]
MRRASSNSPLGSILFGLIFMAGGIFMTFVFSQTSELSCTRLEPSELTCKRTIKLFGLVRLREEDLPTLQSASLSESCDEDGCSYRVELETTEGVVPLAGYYTGGIGAYDQQTKKVNGINVFLEDKDEIELKLETGLAEILLSFLPLSFLLVGGLMCIYGLRQFLVNWNEIR